MSKVIVAYSLAGLSLFGALFAALALSGLFRPGPTEQELAVAEAAAEPPAPPPTVYIPPPLDAGRVYRVSHETPIYPTPAQSETDRSVLPAGGAFLVMMTLEEPPGPWIEITVNDGQRESTKYLYGMDLRWKTLTPQYSAEETASADQAAVLQRIRDAGGLSVRRERVVVVEPEPEPATFEEWWAEESRRLGGSASANIIVSATAAGLATLLILGSIAALSVLRREHTWSSPAMHDDFEAGPGEDVPYASAASEEDDPFARDEEERPRE